MKKQTGLFFMMICLVVIGCRHHGTSITFKETNHYYSMEAWFSKDRTRAVERYMDERIGNQSNMSFANSRIEGELSMDDHTYFFIKKYPGYLRIKLNKDVNSGDSYEQIRDMCQGIKRLLAR